MNEIALTEQEVKNLLKVIKKNKGKPIKLTQSRNSGVGAKTDVIVGKTEESLILLAGREYSTTKRIYDGVETDITDYDAW